MTHPVVWDFHHDVIVVGSGAGGMTAALVAKDLGLDAIILEKSDLVGGTTAVSAGVIWIPDNPQIQSLSYPDSIDEALTYLNETVGGACDDDRIRAYLETGPALVHYLQEHTRIAFCAAPLPDYYSNLPGGKDKYRALDPIALNARQLGEKTRFLRRPHPQIVVAGMCFTTAEVATILRKDPGWLKLILGQIVRQYIDLPWWAKFGRSPRLTLGNALVGRCMLSLQDRGIPVWRKTALKGLVRDDTGVIGIVAEQENREIRIRARRGVILAAGGFSANPVMRRTHLTRSPNVERSVAPDINTGDAITAGVQLGADTDLMDEAWWIPVYRLSASKLTCGMFLERAFPGCIIVNHRGERFMNDAANYDETGRAMANAAAGENVDTPSYFIFDARFRRNYIAGPLQPSPAFLDPFLSRQTKALVVKARSLASLADKLKIDPAALTNSIERFNDLARLGEDTDFRRGEETYDRHYSDPRVQPNSTMAPITKAPFYAMPIYPGDIGTKGGLVTDKDARVRDVNGNAIEGLYAIGNSAASIMGRAYPGGGATIGPSMVFGARAAMHIVGGPLPE